jgi:hypothetical protein
VGVNWALILGFTNLALLALAGILLWYQIRSSHEWNRRKAAHDFLGEIILGKFVEIRRKLEEKIDPYDLNQTYATKKGDLSTEDTLLLRELLNYLEELCLAIKHGIIDEDIAYESVPVLLCTYWRWAEAYVHAERRHSPLIWIEVENVVKRWKQRMEKDRCNLVKPGKGRL